MNAKSLLMLLPVLTGTSLAAPVEIGAGISTYSEDFDLLSTVTNNAVSTSTWTDDTTIAGWWLFRAGQNAVPTGYVSATAPYAYYVGDGAAPPNTAPLAHGFYSLGTSGIAERALGLCPTTGHGEQSAILVLHNPNASSVQLTNVKFKVEAYRENATANNKDTLFMSYRVTPTAAAATTVTTAPLDATIFPPPVSTGPTTPQYYITGWNSLNEFRHIQTSGAVGQISPVGVEPFNAAPASSIIVPAGQFLALRWSNINDNGTDAMQGIDDLELTFTELNAAVLPVVTNIAREPGAVPGDFSDDIISFDLTVTGVGAVSPTGWITSATSAVAPGSAGTYGAPVHLSRPVSEFGATGTANITVQDAGTPTVETNVSVTAPKYLPKVTATINPGITFTPATAGATAFVNPFNAFTDLGWSGGAGTTNVVEVQPMPNNTGNKYFVHTSANATMISEPVSLSEIGGQAVELEVGVGAYTDSGSGLEDDDTIAVNLEVALDGNFANTAPGNLLRKMITGADGANTPLGTAWGASIAVADPYIDIDAAFPAADFTIHKFKGSIPVPAASAATALARVVFASTNGITTEHVLLDDVVFRAVTTPSLVVTTPANVIRNANGAGPADDTITFTVDIAGLAVSPQWSAPAATPATGAYGTGLVLTVPTVGTDVTRTGVTVTDSVDTAVKHTFVVRHDPVYLLGTANLGGGPQDVFSLPVNAASQAWDNTPAAKTTRLNNSGNTNAKTLTSDTVNLTGISGAQVDLTLGLEDHSNGFEAGDHFELSAILNANTPNATTVNLITNNLAGSYDDGAPATTNPGVAGDGFLSAGELVPDPNPDNTAAVPFLRDLTFRYIFPAGTTSASIVVTATNESANEFLTIKDFNFSLSNFVDTDGDGMEDSYEDANGLNKNDPADKLTDLDGDGQSNYAEYLSGTAANDSASFLHVTDGTLDVITGNGSTTWASVAGKKYRVQLSGDLAAWTDAGTDITATGPTTTASYTIPGAPLTGKGFLRVKVVP